MLLKDKVAIVTGGGRGIGRATALRFVEEGAKVVIADLALDKAIEVVNEINEMTSDRPSRQVIAHPVDVTDPDSVTQMIQATMDAFGRVDVLVNNAGIVQDAQLVKMETERFDAVIDVNLKGVFNCSQAVASIMVTQGSGVILNASSIVGTYGNFGQTNYAATKAGVVAMTKVWARELGRKGVRVNAVAPGFVQTRLMEGIPERVLEGIVKRVPQARLGRPEEIANAYLWLASDQASYVNGHVLAVDGGAVI